MTQLQAAADSILRLWKDGKLTAHGHAGVTVEVALAMKDLEKATDRDLTEWITQEVERILC